MGEMAVHPESTSEDYADGSMKFSFPRPDTPAELELVPEPICSQWILNGNPVARSKVLAVSPDGASKTVLWDCTAGSFHWHYRQDEAVLFLSGDACLVEENGKEQYFTAGDFAFFPAGTVAHWRVDTYVRKIAFLREPVWRFAVPFLTFSNKILRKLGFTRSTDWTRTSLQRLNSSSGRIMRS